MFSDLTSGTETYPAGRYIDLYRNATGLYELDFNRAFNPYCYYNESYDCPFPPPENRLQLPIRAGEAKTKAKVRFAARDRLRLRRRHRQQRAAALPGVP